MVGGCTLASPTKGKMVHTVTFCIMVKTDNEVMNCSCGKSKVEYSIWFTLMMTVSVCVNCSQEKGNNSIYMLCIISSHGNVDSMWHVCVLCPVAGGGGLLQCGGETASV